MNISTNARKVLEKRYLLKDENGHPSEDPDDMLRRVADNIASAETDPEMRLVCEIDFYQAMKRLEFLPNSPTLMNAGRKLQQLSACFVLEIKDSMMDIFETVKNTAIIHKSGGGTGFSFGKLRPKGSNVQSTSGVASGPISFMKVFNASTEAVKQGGKRRGANMGILPINHPDILEFITCKQEDNELNNFNISVAITDEFMDCVKHNRDYSLVDPSNKETTNVLNAREVLDLIVKSSHASGDPGIIFIDRMNKYNPTPELGLFEATNPCGEVTLLPYEACNLGSVNLSKFINDNPDPNDKMSYVDWKSLKRCVSVATRFLDNVVTMNKFPLEKISEMTLGNRKIGLGVMGWADMLCKLNIPYNSTEALDLADEVMKFINTTARLTSEALGKEKGNFPNIDKSIYKGKVRRNAAVTVIAPTGTLSIIANCSSGIEPVFAICYTRHILDGTVMIEINPLFEQVAKTRGFYSKELMDKIAITGSIQGIEEIPKDVRDVFVTSHDISPESHVAMQAAFQAHVDNAVSKTVNLSNDATVEDVEEVYMFAYETGCKGITIFRDGSKSEQVLKIDHSVHTDAPKEPRKRPETTFGMTEKIETGCGTLYVTINEDSFGPIEILTTIGKAGGCATAQTEGIGRLSSLALRNGVPLDKISHHLGGLRCNAPRFVGGGQQVLSCPDGVSKIVSKYVKNRYNYTPIDDKIAERSGACPECGSAMEQESGCSVCRICGFSKCH